MERFQEVVGIKEGDTLSAEALARVFGATEGLFRHSPAGARRIAFLNKLDLLPSPEEGLVLAQEILNRFPGVVERAVLGSVQQNTYFIVMNKAASSRGHG
jgi:probable selenium-dependent hydroxylase accessory protein YqeC